MISALGGWFEERGRDEVEFSSLGTASTGKSTLSRPTNTHSEGAAADGKSSCFHFPSTRFLHVNPCPVRFRGESNSLSQFIPPTSSPPSTSEAQGFHENASLRQILVSRWLLFCQELLVARPEGMALPFCIAAVFSTCKGVEELSICCMNPSASKPLFSFLSTETGILSEESGQSARPFRFPCQTQGLNSNPKPSSHPPYLFTKLCPQKFKNLGGAWLTKFLLFIPARYGSWGKSLGRVRHFSSRCIVSCISFTIYAFGLPITSAADRSHNIAVLSVLLISPLTNPRNSYESSNLKSSYHGNFKLNSISLTVVKAPHGSLQ